MPSCMIFSPLLLTQGQVRTKHLPSQQLGSVRLRSASRLRGSRSHQAVDESTR